jgi:hypothetical protein
MSGDDPLLAKIAAMMARRERLTLDDLQKMHDVVGEIDARLTHIERQTALYRAQLPPGAKPNGHLIEGAQ